jgi:putative ABC transport system permease protein
VAAQTGDARPDVFLLDTTGSKPREVAARVRTLVGASSIVTDRETSRRQIGSSLTAVDLRGLTRVELAYALVLAAAAAGLVFALGLAERRRSFAITVALGARPRQVGAFVWSEAVVLAGAALVVGLATGFGLSQVLVKVLTGVFDPPPSRLAIPWSYLVVLLALIVVAITSAAGGIVRTVRRPALSILRDL